MNCPDNVHAHFLPHLGGEWLLLVAATVIVEAVGRLYGIAVCDWDCSIDYRPGSSILTQRYLEDARVEPEHRCQGAQQSRQLPALVVGILGYWVLWSVDEHVLFDRVPVEINEHVYSFVASLLLFYELLQVVYLRKCVLALLMVSPVQVLPEEAGPIVASHHSVRVHHRNYPQQHLFAKLFGRFIIGTGLLN